MDGNLVGSIGWPGHGEYTRVLLESIGAKISRSHRNSVLVVLADYAEDYEVNVPFRALQGLGCRVDAVCPSKKKGESSLTAILDDEGAQICTEKRGHNFVVNANWSDISADDYDFLVLPGGRSPELLVINEKVVSLIKEFADKGKIIAAIGQGKWVVAAAGALKGKRSASSHGMKAIVKWLVGK
ncbi:DJ-1 protein homolog E-like [Hevea brasiliensis]|uniref:DJ-1 protein homolog E-like n=1 Tax=Hevea brasiliensis TaxID=3981 RepID=UPI0025CEF31E|nr:DJ-1 protein homolog E-like [Hevea brasiliensis]